MNQLGVDDRRGDTESGWTFLETVVVIAVVLILSATVGIASVRLLGRARAAAARSEIQLLSIALESYNADCGRFPTPEQGLDALFTKPDFEPIPPGWAGPYLSHPVADDPWGRSYEYRVPGPDGLPYGIRSYGADGSPGGEGQNADLTSWEVP